MSDHQEKSGVQARCTGCINDRTEGIHGICSRFMSHNIMAAWLTLGILMCVIRLDLPNSGQEHRGGFRLWGEEFPELDVEAVAARGTDCVEVPVQAA